MRSVEKLSNNKIKEIKKLHQKKYRDESNLFIAEGEKAVKELIEAKIEILEVYSTDKNSDYTIISEDDMKKISTTASACEVLAIARKKTTTPYDIKDSDKIILLDSISDPGNLGTIIRSAAAFNTDAIILFNNCVELYSPKVIRSCAGNFFKTPVAAINSIDDLNKYFPSHVKIATALNKSNNISISEIKKYKKYIIMFGSEAEGLTKDLLNITDKYLKLNMSKNVESLNLAVCTSVILYELYSK